MKLASDPNNPVRMIPDDLSSDELRAEVNKHIARLDEAGVLDLEALLGVEASNGELTAIRTRVANPAVPNQIVSVPIGASPEKRPGTMSGAALRVRGETCAAVSNETTFIAPRSPRS
jgi:hypothetical protein